MIETSNTNETTVCGDVGYAGSKQVFSVKIDHNDPELPVEINYTIDTAWQTADFLYEIRKVINKAIKLLPK